MAGGIEKGGWGGGSLPEANIPSLSLLQRLEPFENWIKIKLPPLGNRVKFDAYRGEGWGINFLALDKPTYQILASY